MLSWIVIGILYVVGIGFFRWLGGLGAAGDVFRRWGKATSTIRTNPGSSS